MNKFGNNYTKRSDINKKTRIAHIFNHSYFLGGGEISFFELIRKLDKQNFKSIVIVPASGEIEKKLRYKNIEVHSMPLPPLKSIIRFSPLKAILNLIHFLRRNQIDLIHANGSRVCFYGAIVGRIIKTPVIWHVRESIKDMFFYDWMLAILANAIICVSKSVQLKRFGRFGERIAKKIYVVYNGVDTIDFRKSSKEREEVRAKLSLKSFEVLIGLIGNIIPRKSQDLFLKGCARAKQIKPDIPIKIILVGHFLDDKFNSYLRKLVSDLELDSNVIFQKFSNDIANIYSALDIFAITSKSEGFCRSLLEAMSSSLPIIATRLSEIEEALVDNKNAILIDYRDIEAMASAIITLSRNVDMRAKLGSRNRLKVKKEFSLVLHTKRIENLYSEIA